MLRCQLTLERIIDYRCSTDVPLCVSAALRKPGVLGVLLGPMLHLQPCLMWCLGAWRLWMLHGCMLCEGLATHADINDFVLMHTAALAFATVLLRSQNGRTNVTIKLRQVAGLW